MNEFEIKVFKQANKNYEIIATFDIELKTKPDENKQYLLFLIKAFNTIVIVSVDRSSQEMNSKKEKFKYVQECIEEHLNLIEPILNNDQKEKYINIERLSWVLAEYIDAVREIGFIKNIKRDYFQELSNMILYRVSEKDVTMNKIYKDILKQYQIDASLLEEFVVNS